VDTLVRIAAAEIEVATGRQLLAPTAFRIAAQTRVGDNRGRRVRRPDAAAGGRARDFGSEAGEAVSGLVETAPIDALRRG